MTEAVQAILNSFESLPKAEQHETVLEILRRYSHPQDPDLPDAALVGLADALFLTLDQEESSHASGD